MRESTLKSLDWLLVTVLLFLWPLTALLPYLLRRERKGIALIRPGGMGDLICLEMALQSVPAIDSDQATFFIDARSAVWADYRKLKHVRYDKNSFWTLLLHAGRYEKVVVTEQRFGAAAVYGLLLGPKPSQAYGFASQRMRHALGHTVSYSPISEHEVSSFSRLLRQAGGEHSPNPLTESDLIRHRIFESEGNELWVSIAGCGVPSRELHADVLAPIIRSVAAGRPVILTHQPSDKLFADGLARVLGDARLFEGDFNALCNSLSLAPEVLTIDGGMVHICSYFGVPAKVLFSAGVVEKWRPLGSNSQVALVPAQLTCRPCTRFGQVPACPIGYACKAFTPDIFDPHVD